MKRRLFWKIWMAFFATILLLGSGLWLFWSLRPAQVYPEWDGPYAVGNVLIESAATALRDGGSDALARQTAAWPGAHRARLTVTALSADRCQPEADHRRLARQIGQDYCLRYATPPLPAGDGWSSQVYLIATALAGLVFSAALAWYLTRPIHRLRRGFERLAGGDLSVRLGPSVGRRRDEVADLARDFDQMATRLEELVAARDRLLHDVSHELRSPLARMRLATGLLRRDPSRLESSLDRVDREADQLDALIGELLTLAKLESGVDGSTEYFDLLDVLELVLENAGFEAAAAGVTLNADLPDEGDDTAWLILGSGLLAHRAIENILRNALRFSASGQTIDIRLERCAAARCIVMVDDQGPGIGESGPSDLLQPFVQGGAVSGSGFGLGLAIAQRAIATCGGSVKLANRAPSGLRVTISLPLARDIAPA